MAACTQVPSVLTRLGGTYTSPTSVLVPPPPPQAHRQHQEPPELQPDINCYISGEPVIACNPASPQPSGELTLLYEDSLPAMSEHGLLYHELVKG